MNPRISSRSRDRIRLLSPAAASQQHRHLTEGFDLADSWATDGHKWPNVGYDCGIAMVRNPAAVRAAMAIAHKILVAAYHMLANGSDYRDLGEAYLDRIGRRAATHSLVRRLERLGFHAVDRVYRRPSQPRGRVPSR